MRINVKKLIVLMYDRDINMSQLSEASGVSRGTLSAIRSGKSCSDDTVIKIARALGVELDSLIDH